MKTSDPALALATGLIGLAGLVAFLVAFVWWPHAAYGLPGRALALVAVSALAFANRAREPLPNIKADELTGECRRAYDSIKWCAIAAVTAILLGAIALTTVAAFDLFGQGLPHRQGWVVLAGLLIIAGGAWGNALRRPYRKLAANDR